MTSTTIPREYNDQGIRILQTGAEIRLDCGRTIQMHVQNPEWMADLLAKLETVPEVGRDG